MKSYTPRLRESELVGTARKLSERVACAMDWGMFSSALNCRHFENMLTRLIRTPDTEEGANLLPPIRVRSEAADDGGGCLRLEDVG